MGSRNTDNLPFFAGNCKVPEPLENGRIIAYDYSHDSSITFMCNSGYDLRGPTRKEYGTVENLSVRVRNRQYANRPSMVATVSSYHVDMRSFTPLFHYLLLRLSVEWVAKRSLVTWFRRLVTRVWRGFDVKTTLSLGIVKGNVLSFQ